MVISSAEAQQIIEAGRSRQLSPFEREKLREYDEDLQKKRTAQMTVEERIRRGDFTGLQLAQMKYQKKAEGLQQSRLEAERQLREAAERGAKQDELRRLERRYEFVNRQYQNALARAGGMQTERGQKLSEQALAKAEAGLGRYSLTPTEEGYLERRYDYPTREEYVEQYRKNLQTNLFARQKVSQEVQQAWTQRFQATESQVAPNRPKELTSLERTRETLTALGGQVEIKEMPSGLKYLTGTYQGRTIFVEEGKPSGVYTKEGVEVGVTGAGTTPEEIRKTTGLTITAYPTSPKTTFHGLGKYPTVKIPKQENWFERNIKEDIVMGVKDIAFDIKVFGRDTSKKLKAGYEYVEQKVDLAKDYYKGKLYEAKYQFMLSAEPTLQKWKGYYEGGKDVISRLPTPSFSPFAVYFSTAKKQLDIAGSRYLVPAYERGVRPVLSSLLISSKISLQKGISVGKEVYRAGREKIISVTSRLPEATFKFPSLPYEKAVPKYVETAFETTIKRPIVEPILAVTSISPKQREITSQAIVPKTFYTAGVKVTEQGTEVVKGIYEGVRTQPIKTIGTFAIGFGVSSVLKTIPYVARSTGAMNVFKKRFLTSSAATKIRFATAPQKVSKLLTASYVGSTAIRVAAAPSGQRAKTFGMFLSTEYFPFRAGMKASEFAWEVFPSLASRTAYQVRRIPERVITQSRRIKERITKGYNVVEVDTGKILYKYPKKSVFRVEMTPEEYVKVLANRGQIDYKVGKISGIRKGAVTFGTYSRGTGQPTIELTRIGYAGAGGYTTKQEVITHELKHYFQDISGQLKSTSGIPKESIEYLARAYAKRTSSLKFDVDVGVYKSYVRGQSFIIKTRTLPKIVYPRTDVTVLGKRTLRLEPSTGKIIPIQKGLTYAGKFKIKTSQFTTFLKQKFRTVTDSFGRSYVKGKTISDFYEIKFDRLKTGDYRVRYYVRGTDRLISEKLLPAQEPYTYTPKFKAGSKGRSPPFIETPTAEKYKVGKVRQAYLKVQEFAKVLGRRQGFQDLRMRQTLLVGEAESLYVKRSIMTMGVRDIRKVEYANPFTGRLRYKLLQRDLYTPVPEYVRQAVRKPDLMKFDYYNQQLLRKTWKEPKLTDVETSFYQLKQTLVEKRGRVAPVRTVYEAIEKLNKDVGKAGTLMPPRNVVKRIARPISTPASLRPTTTSLSPPKPEIVGTRKVQIEIPKSDFAKAFPSVSIPITQPFVESVIRNIPKTTPTIVPLYFTTPTEKTESVIRSRIRSIVEVRSDVKPEQEVLPEIKIESDVAVKSDVQTKQDIAVENVVQPPVTITPPTPTPTPTRIIIPPEPPPEYPRITSFRFEFEPLVGKKKKKKKKIKPFFKYVPSLYSSFGGITAKAPKQYLETGSIPVSGLEMRPIFTKY